MDSRKTAECKMFSILSLVCSICFCTAVLVRMYVMGASKAKGSTFMQAMLPVSAPAARKLHVAKLKNRFIRAMLSEKAHLHTSRDCSQGKKATLHTSKDCRPMAGTLCC